MSKADIQASEGEATRHWWMSLGGLHQARRSLS
jgi:hypothetical protein